MLIENLRDAYRSLRSARAFALTAILSLAVGIGGSVAMFTLVNSILLKPLGYSEPDRLVVVTNVTPKTPDVPVHGLVPIQFIRWRKEIQSFESFAVAGRAATINLTGSGQPEILGAMRITSGFFDTLKVAPQSGRWFTESEEKRGSGNVVVLSDSLWRRRFSAATNIIGSRILLNDTPYEVVGITPPDLRLFRGRQAHPALEVPERTDIFLPIRFSEDDELGGFHPSYLGIARLKDGVTVEQARAELDATLPSFHAPATLAYFGTHIGVQPLQTALVGGVSRSLLLLLFSVGLLLLISCVNVANLSLVRATQRSRELAIRVAIGAGRDKLMGLVLAESFLLALGGTAVGWILSLWIADVVISRAAAQLPRLEETAVDANVFWFAAAVCVLTALICGLLPAWRAYRTDPQAALSSGGRGSTDALRGGRIRSLLVGAEVALGMVLLIGSGLLLASLHNVMNTPRGFDASDVLSVDLVLPSPRYQAVEKQLALFRALHDAIASTPGVLKVAANSRLPLAPETRDAVVREGDGIICSSVGGCGDKSGRKILPLVVWPSVTSEYFDAMRIPLRAGRLFRDDGEVEPVALLSDSAARILWPGENPIGKRVSRPVTEDPSVYWRIIGIVGDVRSGGLDRVPTPAIYRPYTKKGGPAFSVVIRTAIAPVALVKNVRDAVARVDPDIPVPEIRTMPEIIAESVKNRRFQALLLSGFAALAVMLAGIGIYGVVAYSIEQRRKEMGVRLTLGADQRQLRQLIFRNGMAPVFVGLGTGLLVAAIVSRLIASLLFEVRPLDPMAFVGASLILVVAAAIPCWLNAQRAARIDPIIALRFE